MASHNPKRTVLPASLQPALLRADELAEYLRLSPQTIVRLRAGDSSFPRPIRPTLRIAGIARRWRRDEVDAWYKNSDLRVADKRAVADASR